MASREIPGYSSPEDIKNLFDKVEEIVEKVIAIGGDICEQVQPISEFRSSE